MREMRTLATLSPLFRSAHQGQLLALVLLDLDTEHSLTELARRLGVNHSTVSREVDRLEASGLLRTTRKGNLRLVRADPTSSMLAELRSVALKTYGPPWVLGQELSDIDGAEEAWIYGSWAARAQGVPGPPPQDLDVVVVGSADRNQVYRAARRTQHRLGLEVSVIVRSREDWEAASEPFVAKLRLAARLAVPIESRDG